MKLTNCGITIDINPIEASRYLAAGYVEVKDEPVEIPAPAKPEPEAVKELKAREPGADEGAGAEKAVNKAKARKKVTNAST